MYFHRHHYIYFADRSTSFSRMFDLESKGELKQKRCRLTKPSKKGKVRKSESIDTAHSRGMSPCLLYGQTDNQPEPDTVTAIGDRDVALFLFRALGKILYCKSKFSPIKVFTITSVLCVKANPSLIHFYTPSRYMYSEFFFYAVCGTYL